MRLLCGFMGTGVSLDSAEIWSNILFILLYILWGEAGAEPSILRQLKQHILHSPGAQGCVEMLCSDLAESCNSISAIILSINQHLTFFVGFWLFFIFLSSFASVMHQWKWMNSCRAAVLCHNYLTAFWRGRVFIFGGLKQMAALFSVSIKQLEVKAECEFFRAAIQLCLHSSHMVWISAVAIQTLQLRGCIKKPQTHT